MTGSEFAKLINWLEDRWPGTRNYRKADELLPDFHQISERDAWAAAREFFYDGRRSAPTASELIGKARELARAAGRAVEADPCAESHTWAIVEDHDDGIHRDVICAVCKLEQTVAKTAIQSLAETDPDQLQKGRVQTW